MGWGGGGGGGALIYSPAEKEVLLISNIMYM